MAQALRRASASAGHSALRYMQAAQQSKRLIFCASRGTAAAAAASSWDKGSLTQVLFGCSRQSLVRCMSSGSDGGLLRVLKSEIEFESEQDKAQAIEKTPPKPFTLHDKPGTQEIVIRRSYGSEDIAITCVFQNDPYANTPEEDDDQADEDDDDEQVTPESVHMTVSISKGGDKPVLEISSVTSGEDVSIERVAYLENPSDKELVYDGPEFVELDEELQKQFQRFLESRGVNEELGHFLMQYMPEKERQEYVRWLKNVEAFIKV
ncbi:hypothetical protein O6H91_01G005600 [Diphasiastrum complanatum]|uniref:Uncharacterized protein n=1 Tax=Diphasiastrum complanatum TaxID=34168 RepID=A0ACC2EMV0_DIPCM|nr:hypothetical protein O6H91_01G005600 [Diphasiastrum complanatum]